ncbi:hypothetical protein CTAYLR_002900 [Chrysophaeum taylorii]|uniref:Fungal lipase-type domain-containing protein n=1 Tax=Chrysophaeum taylorii TaxID=2483200 RepID=A0AAD7UM68_9STRA|nr:hypothetical protein CTAYLR_002900 [Chrysophaeum taylorii]
MVRGALVLALLWRLTGGQFGRRKRVPEGMQSMECRQCASKGKERGAWGSLEAFAMAALAALAYEPWERVNGVPRLFEVNASVRSTARRWSRWRHFALEGSRWSRCAWRATRRVVQPPGSRWPRLVNYTRGGGGGAKHCDAPGHRVWRLAWWLHSWYENGPASTRWHSTNALVATNPGDGTIAVAFRGSTDARHAVTNVQPLTRDEEGRTLHGMRRAFERVDRGKVAELDRHDAHVDAFFDGMPTTSNNLAACLSRFLHGALKRGRRVLIAGHSLGGVLAFQLAMRLPPTPAVAVYTFGEPEYGDATFYAARRRHRDRWIRTNYHRFVAISQPPQCDSDLVTRVTRPFGGGGHFAAPEYVCERPPPPGAVAAHAMTGYMRALRDRHDNWLALNYTRGPDIDGLFSRRELDVLVGARDADQSSSDRASSQRTGIDAFFFPRWRRRNRPQPTNPADATSDNLKYPLPPSSQELPMATLNAPPVATSNER